MMKINFKGTLNRNVQRPRPCPATAIPAPFIKISRPPDNSHASGGLPIAIRNPFAAESQGKWIYFAISATNGTDDQ